MGQKHRAAMAEARARLNARYAEAGVKPLNPCHECNTATLKTVTWPGQEPIPACRVGCALRIAGHRVNEASWG